MKSLVLTSILLATIAVPVLLARAERPRRALLQMVVTMVGVAALYLLVLRYLYPRL